MQATMLHFLNSTSPAQLLIASIWQGLLLTASLWLGLKLAVALGVRLRASARFTLWLIVFLLVALLPAIAVLRGLSTAAALPAHPVAGFSLRLNPFWGFALEAFWAASSLLCLGRLLLSAVEMKKLFAASIPVSLQALDGAPLPAALSGKTGRPVEIRLSECVDAPSVVGFFHPAVIMPRSLWSELSPAELRHILLHELAHLERGDDWTNLLQKLLRGLCPLNPALLWAERHLCRERERACDDAVLDAAGNPRAYATCLTRLAESRLVRRATALAPGLWKRPSELAARVDNILHRRPTLSRAWSRGVLAVSLMASSAGAFLLPSCPGLVAFTSAPVLAARSSVPDLASAKVVLTNYRAPAHGGLPGAGFHNAVFHPAADAPAAMSRSATAVPRHPRKRLAAHLSTVRLIQLSEGPNGLQAFSYIVFTVVEPRELRAGYTQRARYLQRARYTVLPLADETDFSLSNHWIAFQI